MYAHDRDIDLVSTNAIPFGSQRGSKSAGMFQMPINKKIKWKNIAPTRLSEQQRKSMFRPNNKKPRSVINAAIRKAAYEHSSYTPRRQKNIIKKAFGGEPIKPFEMNTNVYGTHFRRMRPNVPRNMLIRGSKTSLYFPTKP